MLVRAGTQVASHGAYDDRWRFERAILNRAHGRPIDAVAPAPNPRSLYGTNGI